MQLAIARGPGAPLKGTLSYDQTEHSFRFNPDPADLGARLQGQGVTSVSIGTLQLEVDVESGQVLYAWGLHPNNIWRSDSIGAPSAEAGKITIHPEEDFEEGISIRLSRVGEWETLHDQQSGWLRVSPGMDDDEFQVEVADGVVIGGVGDNINSVWLQPAFCG